MFSIIKEIVGDKNKVSKLYFVDIYSIDYKIKLSGEDFFKSKEIDRNFFIMLDYDFIVLELGIKIFLVLDKEGNE